MKELLVRCFADEKIEYYAVLGYTDCRISSPRIADGMKIEAKSVIVFLLPYFVSVPKNLSAYAASRDYHIAVREYTDRIISRLKEAYPDNSFFGFGDHSPIDERHAALVGGLGILGENRLVINEKYGSYFFIAEIISDLPAEKLGRTNPVPVSYCIGCGACKTACPTGAVCDPSSPCLSAVTQRKGCISEEEAALMRKICTLWGCDECQKCCPYNERACVTPLDFFRRERIEELTPEIFDALNDVDFAERAFAWRGRKTVERNLDILFAKNVEEAKKSD